MKVTLPVLYSQKDSRWGKKLLGNNTNAIYNLENYGCLITALAMVSYYYGKEINPAEMNDKLKEKGGFTAGGGDYIWGSFSKVYTSIKEGMRRTPSQLSDSEMNTIKNALDKGYPVMIQLDYNPKTVALDQHWVLLTDYNPADENDFTIADPIDGRSKSLKNYLGWFFPSARKTIHTFVIYEGSVPKTKPDGIYVEQGDYDSLVNRAEKWTYTVRHILNIDEKSEKIDTWVIEGLVAELNECKKRLRNLGKEIIPSELLQGDLSVSELVDRYKLSEKGKNDLQGKLDGLNDRLEACIEIEKQNDILKEDIVDLQEQLKEKPIIVTKPTEFDIVDLFWAIVEKLLKGKDGKKS